MNQYKIKRGPLDRHRSLTLTPDYIEFENGDTIGQEFTRLNKTDIVDFKHGMNWIIWYEFTVGREFSITIRGTNDVELKVRFSSYFGINGDYERLYAEIVDNIWTYFYKDIADRFLDRLYKSEELQLHGHRLRQTGIQFKQTEAIISWDKVGVKDYFRYFAIFNTDNPDTHARVDFNEYESELLWSIVRTVLKDV